MARLCRAAGLGYDSTMSKVVPGPGYAGRGTHGGRWEAPMPSADTHTREGDTHPLSVLVIDDDVQLRGFLREVLDQAGYRVFEAGNGNEGCALYARHHPDLVLTDIVMPEKEGMELIMELRREQPALPIIAMSGGNAGFSGSYLTVASKLGANASLAKPFTASHLLAAIEQLLKPRFATGR